MDAVTVALGAGAVAAGAALGVAGLRWWQHLQAGVDAVLAPIPPAPPAPEPAPEPASTWQAMPGGRLELRASGFYIQAHFGLGSHPYFALTSPENRELAWSVNLSQLKDLGERLAAEREEFAHLPAQAIALRAISAAKRTDGAT